MHSHIWGLFLESPDNFSAPKSCFVFQGQHVCRVCIQDQGFNNSENDIIKLSVNEAKLTGLWAINCHTATGFDHKICLRPEKFSCLSRNGPQSRNRRLKELLFFKYGLALNRSKILPLMLKGKSSARLIKCNQERGPGGLVPCLILRPTEACAYS